MLSDSPQARFPFARVGALAQRYPDVSERFIRRLIEACLPVNLDIDRAAELYEAHAALLCLCPSRERKADPVSTD